MDALNIKLNTKTLPVELEQDGGVTLKFTLREMPASLRDRHFNEVRKRVEFGPDGKPRGMKTFDGLQGELIQKCLFDQNNQPVPISTIQAWPSSVVQALYNAARKLNDLDKEEEELAEEAKKE